MSDETKPIETRSHESSIEITGTPEQLWQMITEAADIAGWFAPEVTAEKGVGGKVFISWGGGMDINTEVSVWEPGKHLQWKDAERPPIATDFYIETKAAGTAILRLVQTYGTGPEWDGEFDGTKHGWPIFLRMIKMTVERHWGKKCFQANLYQPFSDGVTAERVWSRMGEFGIAWNVESAREASALVVLVPGWNDALLWFTLTPKYVAAMLATYGMEQPEFEAVREQLTGLLKTAAA